VNKGVATPEELLKYNWDLSGVAVNLVSQTGMEPLKQNIDIAMRYGKGQLSALSPNELENRLNVLNYAGNFSWAQKGYYDGMQC
jgi:hypothetical protein